MGLYKIKENRMADTKVYNNLTKSELKTQYESTKAPEILQEMLARGEKRYKGQSIYKLLAYGFDNYDEIKKEIDKRKEVKENAEIFKKDPDSLKYDPVKPTTLYGSAKTDSGYIDFSISNKPAIDRYNNKARAELYALNKIYNDLASDLNRSNVIESLKNLPTTEIKAAQTKGCKSLLYYEAYFARGGLININAQIKYRRLMKAVEYSDAGLTTTYKGLQNNNSIRETLAFALCKKRLNLRDLDFIIGNLAFIIGILAYVMVTAAQFLTLVYKLFDL